MHIYIYTLLVYAIANRRNITNTLHYCGVLRGPLYPWLSSLLSPEVT